MQPLRVTGAIIVPAHELTWRFSRSSGPGGQGVNTTDSRVELSIDLLTSTAFPPVLRERALRKLSGRLVDGVLTVTASEHRSQLRNREAALARLGEIVRDAVAPPRAPRRPTKPTRGAVERRLADKRRQSERKRQRRDYDD